jgi:hypothetical protein
MARRFGMPLWTALLAGLSLALTGFLLGYIASPLRQSVGGLGAFPTGPVPPACGGSPTIAGDFPLPATWRQIDETGKGKSRSYHVEWVARQVAKWYENGADQKTYFFKGSAVGAGPWTFLFRKPADPPCRGVVDIQVAPGGPTTLMDVTLSAEADAFPLSDAHLPLPLPCNGVVGELGDFPYYQGSLNVGVGPDGTGAVWHTYGRPAVVEQFYEKGASQLEYLLRLDAQTDTGWQFTWWRQSDASCWGSLAVKADPAGDGTLVEFHISKVRGSRPPDSPTPSPS